MLKRAGALVVFLDFMQIITEKSDTAERRRFTRWLEREPVFVQTQLGL